MAFQQGITTGCLHKVQYEQLLPEMRWHCSASPIFSIEYHRLEYTCSRTHTQRDWLVTTEPERQIEIICRHQPIYTSNLQMPKWVMDSDILTGCPNLTGSLCWLLPRSLLLFQSSFDFSTRILFYTHTEYIRLYNHAPTTHFNVALFLSYLCSGTWSG